MNTTKKCGRCHKTKPLSDYEKDNIFLKTGNRDGLTHYCVGCLDVERERIDSFQPVFDDEGHKFRGYTISQLIEKYEQKHND